WVIAVFSVPESERERRHALRSRLSWLGFATIASGTWVAPAHAAEAAQEVLERDGLDRYVELFHADHLGFGDVRVLVGQWWDLDGIHARYEEFINAYEPLMERWQRPPATEEHQEVLADYVRLLTSWRQLPYLDPGLPAALLPAGWKSVAAAQLFTRLQAVLEAPARQYATQPG
ncbi:MAG: PaaX family transcriptional regulator, partial [Mycobacteriaceae bacterium]